MATNTSVNYLFAVLSGFILFSFVLLSTDQWLRTTIIEWLRYF